MRQLRPHGVKCQLGTYKVKKIYTQTMALQQKVMNTTKLGQNTFEIVNVYNSEVY